MMYDRSADRESETPVNAASAASPQTATPGDLARRNPFLASVLLGMASGQAAETDRERAMAVMAMVQNLAPAADASGMWETTMNGAVVRMSADQAQHARDAATDQLRGAIRHCIGDAGDALSRYDAQVEVNDEFWGISHITRAWAYVSSGGDVSDPGDDLRDAVQLALKWSDAALDALMSGDYREAAESVAYSEENAQRAKAMVRAWIDGILDSGESIVTGLEFTRNASFVTLGVLAVIASGGVASGALPATMGAFGVDVATVGTASQIALAAPILATLGETGEHLLLGDRVEWGKVGVDLAVQLLLARFGGHLAEGLFGALAKNPVVRQYGGDVFARLASGLLTHEMSVAFSTTVSAVYEEAAGRDITWDQFCTLLVQRMSDPKGVFVAMLMSGAVAATAPASQPVQPISGDHPGLDDWTEYNGPDATPAQRDQMTDQRALAGLQQFGGAPAATSAGAPPGARESLNAATFPGASPGDPNNAYVSGRAAMGRSFVTGIVADVAESQSYIRALQNGEIGLLRPSGSNRSGVDHITARELPDGEYEILANDSKAKQSETSDFPNPKSNVKPTWMQQVQDAVNNVSLGDPVLEAKIRAALTATPPRVRLRQINVDYAPSGQGSMTFQP